MRKESSPIYFYPVIIESCEEGGYFAYCPILQGCHAEGETYGEVIDTIRDVIKTHIELRKRRGEVVPFIKVKRQSDVNVQIPVPVGN